MRALAPVLGVLVVTCTASTAWAHRPTLSEGTARDASTALYIEDVDLSQVVYHEVTSESPQLWLAFDLDVGQSLYFQLGLPVIERLADYRPALVLVGPGLPQVDLPFDVPAGSGAWQFTSDQVSAPTEFYEPFSGTSSWILLTQTIPTTIAGRYYLVAYDPAGQPGKLWVTLGKREEFGASDIAMLTTILPAVRAFHELDAAPAGLPCFLAPAVLALAALYYVGAYRPRTARHDAGQTAA